MAEWTQFDAWVFSSLSGPGPERGRALWEVLFTADAINHLGLGEEEFTTAAGRLTGAGLMGVDIAGDRYWLTTEGYSLSQRLRPEPWYEVVLPALRELGEPPSEQLALPSGTFGRATKRHRKEFWAMYRRIAAEERSRD